MRRRTTKAGYGASPRHRAKAGLTRSPLMQCVGPRLRLAFVTSRLMRVIDLRKEYLGVSVVVFSR
jgi:hypothetical protein